MRRLLVLVLVLAAACRGAQPPAPPGPAPSPAPADPSARGDAAAAAALPPEDRDAIYAVLLGRFFRPAGGQARWIDPRPLAAVRGAEADSAAAPDGAWADAVRETAGGARVCVLDAEDERCRGRAGGILRLSRAYADGGADAARVFVVYTPARDRDGEVERTPGPVLESVFHLERRGASWRIVDHRPVRAP